MLVIFQRLLEISEVPVLVCTRDGTHALHVSELRVLCRQFDGQQGRDVFRLSPPQHIFVSQHKIYTHRQIRNNQTRTRLSITLQRSMYLRASSAFGSSCELKLSNVSKKYEYAVV